MSAQRVLFLIGSSHLMSGGVKVLYKHVEVLCELGYDAYVVNERKNYKHNWFNTAVKCIYYKDIEFKQTDVLVIPETFAHYFLNRDEKTTINPLSKLTKHFLSKISVIDNCYHFSQELHTQSLLKMYDFFKETRGKVLIHNQNMHYSFTNKTKNPFQVNLFHDPNVYFAYTSEYNGDYLKQAFQKEMFRLKWALNTKIFNLPIEEKKISICYMPRKCKLQSDLVIRAIKQDNELMDVEIVPIDGMHELEVARVFKESLFFLSFSELEGCPLPPAEAMSSGCYVIGFTGNGADEYMLSEFCDVINKDDINSFIKQIKQRVNEAKRDKQTIIEKGKLASRFIQDHLSKEEERRLLKEMFSRIETSNSF